MSQDRISASADFTDVIREIEKWAQSNLKLVETEERLIQTTNKIIKGQETQLATIRGVNQAGEQQVTTLKKVDQEWVAIAQSSKVATNSTNENTAATERNTAATERNAAAQREAEKAAAAAASQRGQGLATRNLLEQQFAVPAGSTSQQAVALQSAKGRLLEFQAASKATYQDILTAFEAIENNKVAVATGTNRRIIDSLAAIKSRYDSINASIDASVEKLRAKEEAERRAAIEAEKAAAAAARQRGEILNVRNLLERQFAIPAGATTDQASAIQSAKARVIELADATKASYREIQQVVQNVENNRLTLATGTNRQIQESVVRIKSRYDSVTASIKASTEAAKQLAAEQRRVARAAESAAKAAASQRGQNLNVRNLLERQFPVPGGILPPQQVFNLQNAKAKLVELVGASKKKFKEVEAIWRNVESNRLSASTGANRRIQEALFRLKQQYATITGTVEKTNIARQVGINVTKRLQAETKKVEKNTQGLLLSWQSIGRIIAGQIIRRAFLAFIQAVRQAVEVADDFLIKIGEVRTLSQQNQISTREWASGLRELSDAFGTDILDQTEAAYQTLSNQVAKGAEAFTFLAASNRLALATVSSSSDAVNALTAVLNSYSLQASESEAVSASLFKTVELGRVRLSEISGTIGTVTALGSQLGVSYSEVNAALATLTIRGVKANQAMTQIRGVFAKLIKPTTEMKDLFREMGVTSGEQLISSLGGLEGFLDKLTNTTEGSTTELGKYISRLRGLSGAAILTSKEGLADFRDNLAQIREGTESFDQAVKLTTENIGKRFQIELNKAKNVFLNDFGIPIIETAVKVIENLGGMETIAKVLANTISASVIPATAALIGLLAQLALSNPFGVLLTAAAALAFGVSLLLEKVEELETAYTRRVQEENKKRIKIIEDGVNQNLRAAEQGLNDYANFINKLFSEASKALNASINENIKAFESAEKAIDGVLSGVRKNATSALQEVRNEIKSLESDIDKTTDSIDKILQSLGEELFQLDIADLDIGDQLKRVEEAYVATLQRARESVSAGESDIVRRRLSEADKLFKQLRKLQSDATKTNESNIKKREKIQAKIAKSTADALIKERTLLLKIADARKKGDRPARIKAERELAELRDKQKNNVTEEERKLKAIKDIEFQRVEAQKLLIEFTKERIKIEEESRRKDEERIKALKAQEAQLEILKNQITETSKRVGKFDIQDFFNIKDAVQLDELLKDRQSRIDELIRLGKDERLGTKLTVEEEQKLLTLRDQLTRAAQQRAVALLDEIKRRELLNKLEEQRAGLRGLRAERVEIENNRKSVLRSIQDIQKFTKDFEGAQLQEFNQILEQLGTSLEKGVIDKSVIKESEQLRNVLKQIVEEQRKAGFESSKLASTAEETAAFTGVAGVAFAVLNRARRTGNKEEARDIARIAQVLSNQLNDTEKLFRQNANILAQEKEIDRLYKSVAEASGVIKANVDDTDKKTKTYNEKLEESKSLWTEIKLLTQTIDIDTAERARELGKAIGILRKLQEERKRLQTPSHGGIMRFATGGKVGTDSIPAMLSPGEFVVNARSSKKFFSQLVAMNAAGNRGFANGGNVTVGDVNVSMSSSGNESVDVARIGKLLRREIRRGTLRL